MKNYIKKLGILSAAFFVLWACEDMAEFGDIVTPQNLDIEFDVVGVDGVNPNGDGSGYVDFTAKAANAISYKYVFSDGATTSSPTGILKKRFNTNGTNTYQVTVLAYGTGGVSISKTIDVTVFSNFSDPETFAKLTGGSSRTWYWAAAEPGHLGVGQNDANVDLNFYPNYYAAAPFEKGGSPTSSCLYENELTFRQDGENLKFTLNNNGKTFFNADFVGLVGATGTDGCYDYNTSGEKNVLLGPSSSVVNQNPLAADQTTGTEMTFSDGGFMGYYIGQSTYEILSITDSKMVVRAVMGGNPALAWYHTFSTSPPVQSVEDFTTLVWSDEFNVDGAPDATKWTYDLGNGTNGWGNSELQNYTNRPDNVIVEGGNLKITAKSESLGGFNYTSARLKSEGKFSFKYGKVEIRAKLPQGSGTWPALWMLGANYNTNPWPACGEIDIMEHKGNEPNKIHATLHYPGNSGGNGNTATTTVNNVSSEFHIYKVVWTANTIKFYVDDTVFHSYNNVAGSPFNDNFFMIMNVAMGGTFGGTIAPGFTQSTMEVDYIKVFQ